MEKRFTKGDAMNRVLELEQFIEDVLKSPICEDDMEGRNWIRYLSATVGMYDALDRIDEDNEIFESPREKETEIDEILESDEEFKHICKRIQEELRKDSIEAGAQVCEAIWKAFNEKEEQNND